MVQQESKRRITLKQDTVNARREVVSFSYGDAPDGGLFEQYSLRPGLEMVLVDHDNPEGHRMAYAIERAPVTLSFNLSRHNLCRVTRGDQKGAVWERNAGDTVLAYLPESEGIIEIPKGERIAGVSFHFSPAVFRGLFQSPPDGFTPLFSENTSQSYYWQTGTTPMTAAVLEQMFTCTFEGDLKRLFFESKAIELLARVLSSGKKENRTSAQGLSRFEMMRVREGFHILLNNLENPPSLDQLGRQAGINRNKLNRGFRLLYGDSVFNVLRKLRLARAWHLLLATKLSLVEIAFSVGYSSQSNFTTAFRQQWGKTPKAVRQEGINPPFSLF